MEAKHENTTILALSAVASVVIWILKYEPVQKTLTTWMEELVKRRPSRVLARRLTDEELAVLSESAEVEVENLTWLIHAEYGATRVTLTEYEIHKDGNWTASILAETREAGAPSVRPGCDKRKLTVEMRAFAERINALPTRSFFLPDARLYEEPVIKKLLLDYGTRSAFYTVFPTASGLPGALLSVTWESGKELTPLAHVGLSFSAKALAGLLRISWAHRAVAQKSPSA